MLFIWLNNNMRSILYVDLKYFRSIIYFNYVVIFFVIYYHFVVKVRVMDAGMDV